MNEKFLIKQIIKDINVGDEVTAKDVVFRYSRCKWCPRPHAVSLILSNSVRFKCVGMYKFTDVVDEYNEDVVSVIDEGMEIKKYSRVCRGKIYKRVA